MNSSISRIDSLGSTQRTMKLCMTWNPPSSLLASTFAPANNYSILCLWSSLRVTQGLFVHHKHIFSDALLHLHSPTLFFVHSNSHPRPLLCGNRKLPSLFMAHRRTIVSHRQESERMLVGGESYPRRWTVRQASMILPIWSGHIRLLTRDGMSRSI